MKHRFHNKRCKRRMKKYKQVAAAAVGAALLTSAMLPGLHAAVAQANANPNPITAVQELVRTGRSGSRMVMHFDANNTPVISWQAVQEDNQTAEVEKPPVAEPAAAPVQTPDTYGKAIEVKATAYAPGPQDNDQWGNKTRLGTQIRPGVIAVDPRIIPLGSKVYIKYPDGHGEYAVAEDTGGAIKGNRIDIAMQNRDQAKNFGIRHVKLYIVSTPQEAAIPG